MAKNVITLGHILLTDTESMEIEHGHSRTQCWVMTALVLRCSAGAGEGAGVGATPVALGGAASVPACSKNKGSVLLSLLFLFW